MIRCCRIHHHTHQSNSVFLRKRHQGIIRHCRVAGFSTSTVFVQMRAVPAKRVDHFMVIVTRIFCLAFICLRKCIAWTACDHPERLVFVCLCGNQCHIIRADPVIFIRQTITVIEMRIRTSQFLCALIHPIDKRPVITTQFLPHMFRNRISTFIGRLQHNRIQTLLHRQFFSKIPGNMGSISLIFKYRIRRKRNDLIHITVFDCQKNRHDLCDTRRIMFLVTLLFI